MEIENTTSTETHVEPALETENLDTGSAEGEQSPDEAEGWEPTHKFRTRDSHLEFDDWAKPLIKDRETETRMRDLYERAYGLDVVKGDRDTLREHNSELMESANEGQSIKDELATIGELFRANNVMAYESAFERLQIPDDVIFKYAVHKLRLKEAPPEVQTQYRQQRAQHDEFAELQQQNEQLHSQFSSFQVQNRTNELENILSHPEISSTVSSFDRRAGYEGAFRDAVIKEGKYQYLTDKKDISAREAVQAVMRIAGPGSTPSNYNRNAGVNVVPSKGRPPVLPSSRGNGSSPVKSLPRSIADLRRMAASME